MTTFKINKELEIICEWKKTRNAFKHTATLLENGQEIEDTKICYQNRTWESFEFESVIKKLLDKTDLLTERKKANFLKRANGIETEKVNSSFKAIATVAQIGEVFGKNQKEKNDWKARMLKAGLENKGLIIPEDWNELDEDTKERRLNKVIELLGK